MMTETEVMGACLGKVFQAEPSKFGADQAKIATNVATTLLANGKVDAETFSRVIARLGNHSALRQWAIAHGFLSTDDDALTNAVRAEISRLDQLVDKAVS
jgi:hypothetical protein